MEADIRPARSGEADAVVALLDAALLAFDREAVRRATERGDVLVAESAGRLCGALVLAGVRITAIAVRPRYRRRGIGSALIDAAAARRDRLEATCDETHRPFYAANGFFLSRTRDGRVHGVRETD